MINDTLIVIALPEEAPHLKDVALFTGVGKINATFALTQELLNNPQINKVINFGTGGSVNYNKTGLVRCTTFLQGDMNCEEVGFKRTLTPHEDDLAVIEFGNEGSICSTQDNFVVEAPPYECNIVDMEAYSLAKVCKILGKDFFCYKFISDTVGVELQGEIWEQNKAKGSELFEETLFQEHGIILKGINNEQSVDNSI